MTTGYFVAGTDTEVGKTFVTAAMLHSCRRAGLRAVGMKPVAAGCICVDGEWRNEDVEILRAASSGMPARESINVYALRTAVAPHVAAAEEGVHIAIDEIVRRFGRLAAQADVVLVEGAGGWLVPINERETLEDLARSLALPVILVVGMRLGCINHALLTARAIEAAGLDLAGWVANRIDPRMARFEQNLAALEARLPAPLLAALPHLPGADPSDVTIALP